MKLSDEIYKDFLSEDKRENTEHKMSTDYVRILIGKVRELENSLGLSENIDEAKQAFVSLAESVDAKYKRI